MWANLIWQFQTEIKCGWPGWKLNIVLSHHISCTYTKFQHTVVLSFHWRPDSFFVNVYLLQSAYEPHPYASSVIHLKYVTESNIFLPRTAPNIISLCTSTVALLLMSSLASNYQGSLSSVTFNCQGSLTSVALVCQGSSRKHKGRVECKVFRSCSWCNG